jgi:hypothetical protein
VKGLPFIGATLWDDAVERIGEGIKGLAENKDELWRVASDQARGKRGGEKHGDQAREKNNKESFD